ncbi:hypothetical protein K438DRAFT_674251 [Mycena galopus ATCC 62051]|nr:hypothetical protein K438DRAFT_674251 [Mycena galopus ATCC 62051]
MSKRPQLFCRCGVVLVKWPALSRPSATGTALFRYVSQSIDAYCCGFKFVVVYRSDLAKQDTTGRIKSLRIKGGHRTAHGRNRVKIISLESQTSPRPPTPRPKTRLYRRAYFTRPRLPVELLAEVFELAIDSWTHITGVFGIAGSQIGSSPATMDGAHRGGPPNKAEVTVGAGLCRGFSSMCSAPLFSTFTLGWNEGMPIVHWRTF